MKESPNLDLLRSCAVAFVVVNHLGVALGWHLQASYNFDTLGSLGVALFFVHTTLVLMMSLQRTGPAAIPFLIRRFFRIYPLAVFAVLVATTARVWKGLPLDPAQVASNVLLVQNVTGHESTPGPLWTLPYEVQMYLALPALYAITRWPDSVRWVVRLCAAGVGIGLVAASWRPMHLAVFVPCFLPGMLAFVLGRDRKGRASPAMLFGVIAAAAIAVPMMGARGVPILPVLWGLCPIVGMVIPMCRQITLAPLATAAKVVATYSYGVYLFHVVAISLAFSVLSGAPAVAQWATFAALLAGLPYLLYHAVERPGIRLGVRLAAAVRPKPGQARTDMPA